MKLLVLGATGGTGKHLLEQALAAGHNVTALVRDPTKVTVEHARLVVIGGRATNPTEVETALRGQDAVVAALGPRSNSDPVCAEAAEAIVGAMAKTGVKRVIWLSAGGVGDSKEQIIEASFVFGRIIIPLFLRKPYANHTRAEETLRSTSLDWTVVRPLQLVDEPTGKPTVAVGRGTKLDGLKIARQDVAAFMLAEVSARAHLRQMPLLYA